MFASTLLKLRTALLALLGLAFASMSLAGCNTTKGVGQDIEAAGGALEEKAEETKPY